MKAIEKDRTRRYATCATLAEDVRRYLANEPITARPPSTLYKMRKFARRNRGVLATCGVVLCALFLTMAALAYGYVRVKHERDVTVERETRARAQILLSTMNSVRKYTTDNVRPAITTAYNSTGAFTKEIVPGFAALSVFDNFRKDPQYRRFRYKEASLNPTNQANKADDFEAGLLQRYRTGQMAGEQEGVKESDEGRVFYIARPMSIADQSCLNCHTTPEAAPPEQVRLYGRDSGYGWKMGEIIAAQVVYVPVGEAFKSESTSSYWVIGSLGGVFVLAAVVLVIVLGKA
jgi:mono/diheme cytochrome c family protein